MITSEWEQCFLYFPEYINGKCYWWTKAERRVIDTMEADWLTGDSYVWQYRIVVDEQQA